MAKNSKLSPENLELLGVKRLAKLLSDAAQRTPVLNQTLLTELASAGGPKQAAASIRKRLKTIARSKTFINWQNRGVLLGDLQTQLQLIKDHVAEQDPTEASGLLWEFTALANGIFERCDDSSGAVIGVFRNAVQALGEVEARAKSAPQSLANRISDALLGNDYGQSDGLVQVLHAALGAAGLTCLKTAMRDVLSEEKPEIPQSERKVLGWSPQGPFYQDDHRHSSRKRSAEMALRDIADAQGDVDAFAASYDAKTRKVPGIAADIAERLLKANRAEEALVALHGAETAGSRSGKNNWLDYFQPDLSWENAMIATLVVLGRRKDAQDMRWQCFERHLSVQHLQDHLKNLQDFEDAGAEERALTFVERHEMKEMALWFLVKWPALHHASRLVLRHAGNWDGNSYETLAHAAETLSGRHPLAATLLLRTMIDFTLQNARSTRYKHAARHLLECVSLAAHVSDCQGQENHETYVQNLKLAHAKKASFWDCVNS